MLELPLTDAMALDGEEPPLEDVMLDARLVSPPVPSRLC